MAKMKFLIKKILRTICIWWVMVALLIHAAAVLDTKYQLAEVIVGHLSEELYNGRYHYKLQKKSFEQMPISITQNSGWTSILGFFVSTLQPDTFYKFSIGLDTTDELETGELRKNDNQNLRIYSNTKIGELSYSSEKNIYIDPTVVTINEECYNMFYDASSKTLSCVMYITQALIDENPDLLTHAYFLVSLGTASSANDITLTSYTGIKSDGTYTQILNEISEKLDSIAGGGGLTEEQIDQAIQDALAAHDEQLRAEGQSKLDELMAEINTLVAPYASAANDITNALDGFSDVLNSTSTVSVLTLPEARNPLANNALLWPEYHIDMEAAWNQLPAVFRTAVTVTLTFVILYKLFDEVVFILKYIIIGSRRDE